MALLRKAVSRTSEIRRQSFIQDLLILGVTEYKGKPVRDLDYYEALDALTLERIKRGH